MKFKYLILSLFLSFPIYSEANEWFADSSGIEGKNYVGIHASFMDYQEDQTNFEFEVEGGALRVGHEFNNYLAIEAQAGLTNDDDYLGIDTGIEYFVGHLCARQSLLIRSKGPNLRTYWRHTRKIYRTTQFRPL